MIALSEEVLLVEVHLALCTRHLCGSKEEVFLSGLKEALLVRDNREEMEWGGALP